MTMMTGNTADLIATLHQLKRELHGGPSGGEGTADTAARINRKIDKILKRFEDTLHVATIHDWLPIRRLAMKVESVVRMHHDIEESRRRWEAER